MGRKNRQELESLSERSTFFFIQFGQFVSLRKPPWNKEK